MIEARVSKSHYEWEGNTPMVSVHDTEYLTREMRFAMAIAERWAMVSATPAGEDSAGRQKLKHMPEADVIERAFCIAQLAFERGRKLGWVVNLPTVAEMEAQVKEEQA